MIEDANKTVVYEKDIRETCQKLLENKPPYNEIDYFIQIVRKHHIDDFKHLQPKVVVLGSSIPEELLFSLKEKPYWVLGGSRASAIWSDDAVPRDTDPISRSSLGIMQSGIAKDALIIVPLINDSSRKLTYMLKSEGFRVHPFYIPPEKNHVSEDEWERQIEDCRKAIVAHTKKAITKRSIRQSIHKVRQAKRQINIFLKISEDVLSGVWRMFIVGSYYSMDTISDWTLHLKKLIAEIQKDNVPHKREKSNVLLLGSPIYFPNYKVPFLIEDAGLEICAHVDFTTLKNQHTASHVKTLKYTGMKRFIKQFFYNDASSAYVKNDSLYKQVLNLISNRKIDGVVYHVLKGQIEYDFELERYEKLFESMKIPIFRLETDYNYQDIEQLRIRMEAFSEVLTQRKYNTKEVARYEKN